MSAIHGTVEPYDPESEDWASYEDRFDLYFAANAVTDENQKKAIFLTLIGPKTHHLVKSLCSPDPPQSKSLSALKDILKSHFQPKRNVIAERFKFIRYTQKEGQSITDYVATLRQLAKFCNYGDSLDMWLRDVFVAGLRKENIQRRLLTEPADVTLVRTVEIAEAMEAAEKDTRGFHEPATVHRVQERSHSWQKPGSKGKPHSDFRTGPNHKASGKGAGAGSPKGKCFRCGESSHLAHECRFRDSKCNECGKFGHIGRVCVTTGKRTWNLPRRTAQRNHYLEPDQEESLFFIHSMEGNRSNPPIQVPLKVNNVPIVMELDTGCGVTVMGDSEWEKVAKNRKLRPTNIRIKEYSGRDVQVRGSASVDVFHKGHHQIMNLLVVKGDRPTLLGRNWLGMIRLDWPNLFPVEQCHQAVSLNQPSLVDDYKDVFSDVLGKWKGPPARILINPDAPLKFHKPRQVPFALRDKVEEALDQMVKKDILESVDHSEFAAPIVPVRKSDGTVRICGDFKVTVNPHLIVDQYPLPTAEEAFAKLSGGKEFTTLDMSHAFLQIPIDEEAQKLLVINTHKGLFRFKRLAFGVAPATAILQKRLETLLQGIPYVSTRVDDFIVSGPDRATHEATLRTVLSRLQKAGLKLNLAKCRFFQKEVVYLSHVIDKEGIRPHKKNTHAISSAPEPKNLDELRSFVGMVTYYANYIPNMSTIMAPLYRLTKKDVEFNWDRDCQLAFAKLKDTLCSPIVRVHYDRNLPLIVQCDASPVGVGAVLSHRFPDGSERPVAFTSRILKPFERNYSQLDREALAIIFGVTKFHQYTYGRRFLLRSDHRPLVYLFGPDKGIPVTIAGRLQRWAILLQGYDYQLEHVPGVQNGNADGLSRLPAPDAASDPADPSTESVDMVHLIQLDDPSDLFDATAVAKETARDPILKTVLNHVIQGWPGKLPAQNMNLKPFFERRVELSCEQGCLIMGNKVLIPTALRAAVLKTLHEGHPGIVRMKSIARSKVWWPQIDAQIEAACRDCQGCQENHNKSPSTAPQNKWPEPNEPWERMHLDFAGPMNGRFYLLAVDAESNWVEVAMMIHATSAGVVKALRTIFSHFGLPRTIVTDNGTPFVAHDFRRFCAGNGINHILSPPYHPASNGEVERQVQNLKKALKKMSSEGGDERVKVQRYLMAYRTTPNPRTGKSPAEIVFGGRAIRTRLDQLKPPPPRIAPVKPYQKSVPLGPVWILNTWSQSPKWVAGVARAQLSRWIYEVTVGTKTFRRHADHLRVRTSQNAHPCQEEDYDFPAVGGPCHNNPPPPAPKEQPQLQTRRYPQRVRYPIERLGL